MPKCEICNMLVVAYLDIPAELEVLAGSSDFVPIEVNGTLQKLKYLNPRLHSCVQLTRNTIISIGCKSEEAAYADIARLIGRLESMQEIGIRVLSLASPPLSSALQHCSARVC